jgi:hypothetical protein
MRDPNTRTLQSAVMRWSAQWARRHAWKIYSDFAQAPRVNMEKYNQLTDQGFIAISLDSRDLGWSYFDESEVTSYKAHWMNKPRPDTSIVQLHGDPKPNHLLPDHPLRQIWEGADAVQ